MVLTYTSVRSFGSHRDYSNTLTDIVLALAARTAYAIGLHRTEVNASFGAAAHNTRYDLSQVSQALQEEVASRLVLMGIG